LPNRIVIYFQSTAINNFGFIDATKIDDRLIENTHCPQFGVRGLFAHGMGENTPMLKR